MRLLLCLPLLVGLLLSGIAAPPAHAQVRPAFVVSTRAATGISSNTATVTGYLGTLGDYAAVAVSFEWGAAPGDIAQQTGVQLMTAPGEFRFMMSGLLPSTTYYYRAKGIAESLVLTGSVLTFTTLPPSPAPAAPVYGDPLRLSGLTGGANMRVDERGAVNDTWVLAMPDKELLLSIRKDTRLRDVNGFPLATLTAAPATVLTAPPGRAVVRAYELGPQGATFSPSLYMTIDYRYAPFPAGATEAGIGISYLTGSQWRSLPVFVDRDMATVSANVSHFTVFALTASVPLTPAPRPTPNPTRTAQPPAPSPVSPLPSSKPSPVPRPRPEPANLVVSSLTVDPAVVMPGERVLVSILVANTGGIEGKYEDALVVNGRGEATRQVTLKAGQSARLNFALQRREPGVYRVEIGGVSGQFTVAAPERRSVNWLLIIAVAVAVGALGLLIRTLLVQLWGK